MDEFTVQNKPKFNIVSTNNYEEFCLRVAQEVQDQLNHKGASRLALPAGHSPKGYYKILAEKSKHGELDWRNAICFALDDYLGTNEKQTFQTFLEEHLYSFTNVPDDAKYNPRFYDNYDYQIAQQGGIDLCLLGLGTNGHIAFNEPPTVATSWTHCVFLTQATREANKDAFLTSTAPGVSHKDSLDVVPSRAVTIGIATILASKKIILAVSGKPKIDALKRALYQKPDSSCPASYLTEHPNLLVVTDFDFQK